MPWRRRGCVVVLVLSSGCSGTAPPPLGPAPALTPASSAPSVEANQTPPNASAVPLASAPPAVTPVPVDKCALSESKVVVAERAIRGFDVDRDGQLYWVTYDSMKSETNVFSLELDNAEASPQRVISVKMVADPGALVVGRDGFWMAADDISRGVCGSRVAWLGRDATRAVPVSEPACVSGPKRAEGAEAVWATSKTYSHAMQVVVAKGPPPAGLAPLPRKVEASFQAVVHASDGLYLALEDGEVIRRRPDGVEERVVPPVFGSPSTDSRAVAVHGEHVYLASGRELRKLDVFRVPRAGGDRQPMGTFDVESSLAALHATDSGVVLHLYGQKGADRLLLIDPTGGCPQVELPIPDLTRQVVVDRDVAYVLRKEGIVATSFAGRAQARQAGGR